MNIRRLNNLVFPKRGEIWMLHRVVECRSENAQQRMLEVTSDWLERLICNRLDQGWRFIPISQTNKGKRWICITLDDGYCDNFSIALPLFHKLNVPFCVYVTSGFVDNKIPMWWYPGEKLGISQGDLMEMTKNPLCTIGAHTANHPHLAALSKEEQLHEIRESVYCLEDIIGDRIKHFSYPHGSYNKDSIEICKSLGMSTAVTTSGRTVRTNARPLTLDRINVVQP